MLAPANVISSGRAGDLALPKLLEPFPLDLGGSESRRSITARVQQFGRARMLGRVRIFVPRLELAENGMVALEGTTTKKQTFTVRHGR
jgi:hypothetical protein